jgi:hypothetical protein
MAVALKAMSGHRAKDGQPGQDRTYLRYVSCPSGHFLADTVRTMSGVLSGLRLSAVFVCANTLPEGGIDTRFMICWSLV